MTLQCHIQDTAAILSVLKKIDFDYTHADGRSLTVHALHLPYVDGKFDLEAFFQQVRDSLLTTFVFKCSEIERKLKSNNPVTLERLFEKALRKLSAKTAQGELGELLLFIVLEVFFGAPKLLSKVADKQDAQIPVLGADGVHGQFYDGEMRLFLGEAKLYEEYKPASRKAAKSIETALKKYVKEFDLLDSGMDCPDMTDEIRDEIIDMLDPFSGVNIMELIHSPCFIGFADQKLLEGCATEQEFIDRYHEIIDEHAEHFFSKVEGRGLDAQATSLALLPFSSISELVSGFIDYVGIEQ